MTLERLPEHFLCRHARVESLAEPRLHPRLARLAVAQAVSRSITAKQRKEWAAGTPVAWANGSHRLAIEKVYAGVAADGPPPKLTKADVAKATPVVTAQIKRGGVRLAAVLNQVLS